MRRSTTSSETLVYPQIPTRHGGLPLLIGRVAESAAPEVSQALTALGFVGDQGKGQQHPKRTAPPHRQRTLGHCVGGGEVPFECRLTTWWKRDSVIRGVNIHPLSQSFTIPETITSPFSSHKPSVAPSTSTKTSGTDNFVVIQLLFHPHRPQAPSRRHYTHSPSAASCCRQYLISFTALPDLTASNSPSRSPSPAAPNPPRDSRCWNNSQPSSLSCGSDYHSSYREKLILDRPTIDVICVV